MSSPTVIPPSPFRRRAMILGCSAEAAVLAGLVSHSTNVPALRDAGYGICEAVATLGLAFFLWASLTPRRIPRATRLRLALVTGPAIGWCLMLAVANAQELHLIVNRGIVRKEVQQAMIRDRVPAEASWQWLKDQTSRMKSDLVLHLMLATTLLLLFQQSLAEPTAAAGARQENPPNS